MVRQGALTTIYWARLENVYNTTPAEIMQCDETVTKVAPSWHAGIYLLPFFFLLQRHLPARICRGSLTVAV